MPGKRPDEWPDASARRTGGQEWAGAREVLVTLDERDRLEQLLADLQHRGVRAHRRQAAGPTVVGVRPRDAAELDYLQRLLPALGYPAAELADC